MTLRAHKQLHTASRRQPASGFTLIEVLVVLALTLMMMTMFATIFQMTGTFVTRQKGIGENDQSARILTTVLKTDLEARTMRLVAPFHPNMSTASLTALTPGSRQGYLYVSENDPTDDTDDVLQFTINMGSGNTGLSLFNNPAAGNYLYGRGLFLVPQWQSGTNYAAGAVVRPLNPSLNAGFAYKNEGAGTLTSGATEPTWPTTIGNTVGDGGGTWTTIACPLDQPDGDDEQIVFANGSPTLNPPGGSPNNTGASQFAEITYFLRHGNLYRRVLLIRQPYDPTTGFTNAQPNDGTAAPSPLIPNAYPPYPAGAGSGNFWTDFDYSARISTGNHPGVNFLTNGNAVNSLDNSASGAPLPIGRPDNRFGFDQTYPLPATPPVTTPTIFYGAPREYAFQFNSTANTVAGSVPAQLFFFGRYTHEETSNPNFQFPGNLPLVPLGTGTPISPMGSGSLLAIDSASYTMWMLDANPPTSPLSLSGGPRRGEDILLTNVVSFDVKLWDARYSETAVNLDINRNGVIDSGPGGFADIGHAASGDFAQANNVFPVYGPVIDSGYTVPAAPAPPASALWAPAFTRTFNGVTYNYNNVFDTWYPSFIFDNVARNYDATDIASPNAPAPYRPRTGNTWQPATAYTLGTLVDPIDTANGYVYQCVAAGTSQPLASLPANQQDPFSLGDTVNQLSNAPAPNANSITDGTAQWNATPPLNVQAIQITVKYLDPTQNLLRQVTIVQSLTQ
jgi:prepilin-type N-terminal cleavage/methylation domain-containing protein